MDQKLSWPQKLSFGMGAFGKDLVYGLVATFCMVYFTDVCRIDPVHVGIIFLAARIFDAVNDPVMGLVVDNTRSKYGKFKPWLVIGTVLNAIVLIALFLKFDLSPRGMVIYATITYILWGLTYTIMDIPYWSMIPDLGNTPEERDQVSAIPRLFASAAWMVIGATVLGAVQFLGGGSPAKGYALVALIVAVLFVVCTGITVCALPAAHAAESGEKVEKTSPGQMLRVLFMNEQVMSILFISILFNLMLQFNGGVGVYFFKNVIGNEKLVAPFLSAYSFSQIVGIFCYPILARFIRRDWIIGISSLCAVLTCLMIFLLPDFNFLTTSLASIFFGISTGLLLPILTVLLANGVDYGEKKFGTRNESIIFSTQTFVVKLAGALSGFLIGVGLSLAKYTPDVPLTDQGKWVIRLMMAGLPLLMLLGYLAVYFLFYKSYEERQDLTSVMNP